MIAGRATGTPKTRDGGVEAIRQLEIVYHPAVKDRTRAILAAVVASMVSVLPSHANRGLDVQELDEDRFTNGHRYCGGRTPPDDPRVVHVSWTPDLTTKRERYEKNDLWFVEASALLGPGTETPGVTAPAPPPADLPVSGGSADAQDGAGRELLRRLVEVSRERDRLAGRIAAMKGSTSWRWTAPLRSIGAACRRLVGR